MSSSRNSLDPNCLKIEAGFLQAVFATAPQGVLVLSGTNICAANPTAKKLLGNAELTEHSIAQWLMPEAIGELTEFANGLAPEAAFTWCGRRADGVPLVLTAQLRRVVLGENLVTLAFLSEAHRDAAEIAALRHKRDSYRAFLEQCADSIWCFECQPPIPVNLPVAEQVRRIFAHAYLVEGHLPAPLLNPAHAPNFSHVRRFGYLVPEHPSIEEGLRSFVEAEYRLLNYETPRLLHEGSWLSNVEGWVENGCLVRFWGVMRDVTALRAAQRALARSEQRLGLSLHSAGLALWDYHIDTGAVYVNEQWFQHIGYDETEIDAVMTFWRARLHPEDKERVLKNFSDHLAGLTPRYETEYRLQNKAGEWLWIASVGRVVERAADGQPLRFMGINRDMTEHKKLEEQFLQAQKMEAIGRLAGGIAHDFNNLLTIIKGYASMTLSDLSQDDPFHFRIQEIHQAAERAASLTSQLLSFSRKQILNPRALNLNKIIQELERMLPRLIGEDIMLHTVLEPDLWDIESDPHHLEQSIINLVINARDAMPDGGELTFTTRNLAAENGTPARVCLTVKDNGHGMDEATHQRIFEPFFTTKKPGQGTGLGLSTVYGVMQQSGGEVECVSALDVGTEFWLYFPRAVRAMAAQVLQDAARAVPVGGDETILLVEDDVTVRGLALTVLQNWGYRVLEATDGIDALRVFRQHQEEIDLVLTDAIMPGMGGRELSEKLLRLRPNLRVLWMSGYTKDEMVRRGGLGQNAPFILKPFTLEDLAHNVRNALDTASA